MSDPTIPANSNRRRGACPSAGAAMVSGDGLLSRVRIPGGRPDAATLCQLADWAERWGNGVMEVTRRGNLQIRGLTDDSEQAFTEALVGAGLAVDPPEAEAARNVLSTPAADLDPTAVADPWPLAQALDETLSTDSTWWPLPAKFRMVINGGGATDLGGMDADIRADAVTLHDGVAYQLAIAGTRSHALPLGRIPAESVVERMLNLAHVFLELNDSLSSPATRLKYVLDHFGETPFARVVTDALPATSGPNTAPAVGLPGAHPGWFAAGLPFGALSPATARALAERARDHSGGQIRLTPWRQILLPHAGEEIAPALQTLGLITDRRDPRQSLVACPGAPQCLSGSTPTRRDAADWARQVPALFDGELTVHVSGCEKGCAKSTPTPVTLTARDGRYDLILNDRAEPTGTATTVTAGLPPEEVAPVLKRLADLLRQQQRPGELLAEVIGRLPSATIADRLAE